MAKERGDVAVQDDGGQLAGSGLEPMKTHIDAVRSSFKKTTNDRHHPVVIGLEDASHFCVLHSHNNRFNDSTDYYLADPGDGTVHTVHLDKTNKANPRLKNGPYPNDTIDEIIVVT